MANINYDREAIINALPPAYQKIYSNSTELRFDYEAAMIFIKNDVSLSPIQKNSYENFAYLAKETDLSVSMCPQGRLFYILTFCPRKLRQFLRIRGGNLIQIDIKSCQVLFHTTLYKSDCPEKQFFEEICANGQFWSLINSTLKHPYNLQDDAEKREFKEKCFQQIFFTSKDYLYTKAQIVISFRKYFSILHDLIIQEKQRLRKERGELACVMQKLESEIIITTVIAGLQDSFPDNIFLSIHDCVVCEECMVDEVKDKISRAVAERIGVTPSLDVKPMSYSISSKSQDKASVAPAEIGLRQIAKTNNSEPYESLSEMQHYAELIFDNEDIEEDPF